MGNSWIRYKLWNEFRAKRDLIRSVVWHKGPVGFNKKYGYREIHDLVETNKLIGDLIYSQNPFMICRFGATEMEVINSCIQHQYFPYKDTRKQCVEKLCKLSGFFPSDVEKGEKFVALMLTGCKSVDLCGIWNLYMEDYVWDTYAPNAKITLLENLEPWNINQNEDVKPWTSALKGKTVLVIHPFADTIYSQYTNYRTKLFERKYEPDDILPPFEIKTIKAIQTLNCNIENVQFKDWFEALNYMIEQCKKIEFDVAIIGCGAYGLPLASAIKQMGKGAIHLGGATQILFGIIGKRWETGGYKVMLDQIQNEYWTRPSPSETPSNAEQIENGCYW